MSIEKTESGGAVVARVDVGSAAGEAGVQVRIVWQWLKRRSVEKL